MWSLGAGRNVPPLFENWSREIVSRRLTQNAEASRLGVFVYMGSIRNNLAFQPISPDLDPPAVETTPDAPPAHRQTEFRPKSPFASETPPAG